MDVNGLRSFGLHYEPGGLYPWAVPLDSGERGIAVEAALDHHVNGVRLASRLHGLALQEDAASAAEVALVPSIAVDALGNHVRWDGAHLVSSSHLAARHGLAPRSFALPAEATPVVDMTVGDDDVLWLAANAALWLIDLRGRFELTRLAAPEGFVPQRLAAAPGGGVWALDVEHGSLMRASGLPQSARPVYLGAAHDERLRAADPDPQPPRWRAVAAALPAAERAVALATHRHGRLLVMSLLRADGGGVRLRLLLDDARLSLPLDVAGPRFAHTLAWLDAERIALATRGRLRSAAGAPRDPGVWTYALPASLLERLSAAGSAGVLPPDLQAVLQPQGDYFPLAGWNGGPFANGRPGTRLHYPRVRADAAVEPARVARVSGAARARYGVVANVADGRVPGARVPVSVGLLDARNPGTVWHRLYAEAALPAGCAFLVWLATSDAGPPAFEPGPASPRSRWFPHLFGERSALPREVADSLPADLPRAAWVKDPTEMPHGRSVLCCPNGGGAGGRAGLFTVLVQRAGLAVRALQGTRLWVVVELFGDGRASPELAALRAYAGRLSYRDRYLPALYHERIFGEDAEQPGRASGADFLDRYLHLFEGLFSDIEGRIAASALVTDAMACPPDALPWLAGWVGLALQPGLPTERARWMLANAARLARHHGTLRGLQLALDIATDGAVTRGRLVVVEDFRLRRTLATLLGARLTDRADPLTSGIAQSGNSVVGDTLFLGDAQAMEAGAVASFLALFRTLEGVPAEEQAAARGALFDGLAHRVTVLVHEDTGADELGLVARLSELGAPAHVRVRVVRAAYPLMVGVASLVGADTYLRAPPPSRPVRVGPGAETSSLGGIDTLRGEASLDAHAGAFDGVLAAPGGATPPPVARVVPAGLGADGRSDGITRFTLDGSLSSAAEGRAIDRYDWTHHPPT